MTKTDTNLVWVDCEFTGLDFVCNRIVEIAVVVTDSNLSILGEPVNIIVHHSQEELDALLEEWPRNAFNESGLMQQIIDSTVSMESAEQQILDYVSQYCEPGTCPLAGNSVGQDRRVLYTNMPRFESFLKYRTIDVSTIKELAMRWKPDLLDKIVKKESHRALDDIYESIEELKIYRQFFLKTDER